MFGRLPTETASAIGVILEGFFFGLYTVVFAMYLQYQASKKSADIMQNILFYLLCILYLLSIITIAGDITDFILTYLDTRPHSVSLLLNLLFLQITVTGLCDFLAQIILIYRCWLVWGRNIRVIILPSFFSITFLAIWLTNNGSWYFSPSGVTPTNWGNAMFMASLALSLVVNALVTGLIVFRIFMVYREAKPTMSEESLDTAGSGRTLRSIMFIIIESGMALFSMQLVRLGLYTMSGEFAAMQGYAIILGMSQMIHGIAPTVILVRVSMGLSFHDEKSMLDATTTLRFASDYPNSVAGMESTSTMVQEEKA